MFAISFFGGWKKWSGDGSSIVGIRREATEESVDYMKGVWWIMDQRLVSDAQKNNCTDDKANKKTTELL